ncbi:MAG: cation:dicarboxylase symporter family transporter [Bacilli bacterium]|nr:cation:dicarboxylase symporter family transporter [Bacilli bacterium]
MKKKINLIIFISFILGILFGLLLPSFMDNISFIGFLYINILKFLIVPTLFLSISLSIYKNSKNKNKNLIKIILLFILMFISTFLIVSLLLLIINPNLNISFDNINYEGELAKVTFISFIENIFPSNPLDIISKINVFAIIIISAIFGFSASKVKNGNKVMDIIDSLNNILNKIIEYVMYLTPLGVFSLIGSSISNYGFDIIKSTLIYIFLAYIFSILIVIIMIIILSKKIKPIEYIKKIIKVWLVSLSTCSSVATLPYTLKLCKEDLNLNKETTDIVVPLGTTLNKVGGAISFAILSIFTIQLYGIELNISLYLSMILVSLILNMAAVGIPSGGIVLGATYLSMLGIPLNFIGIYSGIYRILDMAYTTLNVTGNINATIFLNKK